MDNEGDSRLWDGNHFFLCCQGLVLELNSDHLAINSGRMKQSLHQQEEELLKVKSLFQTLCD